MRAYADSSFILKLLGGEADSEAAVGEYQRAGKPELFFLRVHELEIMNAILQRAFHQRRTATGGLRRLIAREKEESISRFENVAFRRRLIETTLEEESVHQRA